MTDVVEIRVKHEIRQKQKQKPGNRQEAHIGRSGPTMKQRQTEGEGYE